MSRCMSCTRRRPAVIQTTRRPPKPAVDGPSDDPFFGAQLAQAQTRRRQRSRPPGDEGIRTSAPTMGMMPPDAVVLALDLGGTQIRAAAILAGGERLERRAAATPVESGEEAIFRACAETLRRVRDALPANVRDRLVAIGISSMGPVDPWRGLVVDPPNVSAFCDSPLADEMERRVGLPAYLERDTNVAALAEHWLGAARGSTDFLYVTVSTGLGGAIVRDGCLVLGPDGTAGELGHITLIAEGGPRCGCGGRGHLEGIAAGAGLAAQAQEAVAAGESAFLAAHVQGHGAQGHGVQGHGAQGRLLTARDVAEGELAGDATCIRLMERARRGVGTARARVGCALP